MGCSLLLFLIAFVPCCGMFIYSVRVGSIWGVVFFGVFTLFLGIFGVAILHDGVEEFVDNHRRNKEIKARRREVEELQRAGYVPNPYGPGWHLPNREPPKSEPTFTPPPPEPPKSKPTFAPPNPEPPKQTPPITGKRLDKQKIPLKEYPGDNRPIISIQLRHGNRTIDCDALIDSGAADTIFHGKFAEQLGIDVTNAPYEGFSGIASGKSIKGYETRIEIGIAGYFYPATVYFSFDLNPNVHNLLGEKGFGEYFYWTRGKKYVEITDRATSSIMFTLQKDK
jgi:hypothetical protein